MSSTRRQFLVTTTCAAAAAACSTPKSTAPLTIIDTHTHFYDPTRAGGVPWPGKGDALLYRPTLPADYRAQPVPQPVTATVVVEASPLFEDNQWILDLAARDKFIVGFVGHLKPGEDAFAGHLKRFAANPLYRGIRVSEGTLRPGLGNPAYFAPPQASYCNGTHVVEIEVGLREGKGILQLKKSQIRRMAPAQKAAG